MGKIKGILSLAVIAAGFYVAWNMIPPYFNNYQLQDDLDDIARRNSYTQTNEDGVSQIVINKARQNDVTLKPEQITVTRGPDGLESQSITASTWIWWCVRLIWTLPPFPSTNGYNGLIGEVRRKLLSISR